MALCKTALSLRMFVGVFALMLFAGVGSQAQAQALAPLVKDPRFGENGVAAFPKLDVSGASNPTPLGFVRTPRSSGYLAASMQQYAGVPTIIVSRFNDDGQLVTYWGNRGSLAIWQMFGVVRVSQARMTVNWEEGVGEMVYLAVVYENDVGNWLQVMRLDSGGILRSGGLEHLEDFADIPGEITAIAPAEIGQLGSRDPGLLMAVQGRINKDRVILVEGSASKYSYWMHLTRCYSSEACFTRPGLRINQIVPREDGMFDLIGTERGKAMHMIYDARNSKIEQESFFDLGCGAGGSTSSVLDGLARDDSLGDAATMVVGRAVCSVDGKTRSVMARLPGAKPLQVITGDAVGGCSDLLEPCPLSSLVVSSGHAYVVTPEARLVHVNTAAEYGRVLDQSLLYGDDWSLSILPTQRFGMAYVPPYLTGMAMTIAPEGIAYGLGRVSLDRIFADGMDAPQ